MQGFTWLSPNTCSVCNRSNDFWLQIDNPKIYLDVCCVFIMVNEKVSLFVRLSTFSRWGVEIAWQLCICTQCYCAVISKCVWFTGAMCSNLSPFIWERVGYLINAVFSIDVCMRNNKKRYNACVNKKHATPWCTVKKLSYQVQRKESSV